MPENLASTPKMEPTPKYQKCRRLTGDGDSGYEVKSLQDVNSLHDMMKWVKFASQFWCALSVQLESLAQEEKKREEVIEAARLKLETALLKLETRLKLEKRREAAKAHHEYADILDLSRRLLGDDERLDAIIECADASDECDASREDRVMSCFVVKVLSVELNRIILNYLKLRHPQFHDGVRSSRQYYEEKDCNGGTKPVVQGKTTQENWPLTADGDYGHHAMDDRRKESKLKRQLMAPSPNPNIKYSVYTNVNPRHRAMCYMQEREIVHQDLKPSNTLVADPVDCLSKTGTYSVTVVDFGVSISTGFSRAPEILVEGSLSTRHRVLPNVDRYARRKADVCGIAMTCYEVPTGEIPFGTEELPYTRMSRCRTRPYLPDFPQIWSTEEIGSLLKTSLLAPKQDGGPDWDYVSEHLLEEYGIDRDAKSCEILWGSLLRRYNAIRDHELKVYNLTKNGPNYFEMDEEERSRNMLPPVFDMEWCKMMETILKVNPGEVQSGTTADECTSLSNDEDVLCGEDEAEDESCESAVSEVEDSTADSYVPQTEPTCTDKETIDASATLRNVVEDMVRPLITALRTRVEEGQKHRQEVLAAEMDKVALMLQNVRRVLVHFIETRGKDLPESPSQQMVPAVASGGKHKADMDVDREAKKQAV